MKKKYRLADLLILVPKTRKPKPRPENAPLADQIHTFEKNFERNYVMEITKTPRVYQKKINWNW